MFLIFVSHFCIFSFFLSGERGERSKKNVKKKQQNKIMKNTFFQLKFQKSVKPLLDPDQEKIKDMKKRKGKNQKKTNTQNMSKKRKTDSKDSKIGPTSLLPGPRLGKNQRHANFFKKKKNEKC